MKAHCLQLINFIGQIHFVLGGILKAFIHIQDVEIYSLYLAISLKNKQWT